MSCFQLFALYLLNEMLGVFKVMWGLANKGFDDVGEFFGYPICDGPPTGNYGPEGGTSFVNFGKAMEFGWDCTGGI